MAYEDAFSIQHLCDVLTYESESGKLFWRVRPSKNVFAGTEAGSVKHTRKSSKTGNSVPYTYIRVDGWTIPAARIVWAINRGEWPVGKMSFKDGDTLNTRIENLEITRAVIEDHAATKAAYNKDYLALSRQVNAPYWRDSDLRRKFGINLHDYGEMLLAQEGKCAICGSRDAGTRNGEKKSLAVDHDHTTGKVRGLLCESCNQGLGKFNDSREVLLKAAAYLEKHSVDSNPEKC